jgi:apolipoprotein D and lipocalin family protein
MNLLKHAVTTKLAFAVLASSLIIAACASKGPEMETVDYVELDRFMGDWYVIGNIPTFLEEGAHNAVETYSLNDDGTIDTTFVFHEGGFDGELKEHNPKGFVLDEESNAHWGMRFIWPIKADYRIVYLDDDYSRTIIARQKRDFVWIMARTPQIPDAEYERLVDYAGSIGYDTSKIQRVPQRW